MRSAETIFLLALAAFLAGFCALGLFYYDYSAALMRFPLLAAGGTLVVVILELVALRRGTAPVPRGARPAPAPAPSGHLVKEGFYLVSVLPLVFLLGFPVGLAVYLLGYLRHAGESWGLSLAVAAASLGLSYGIFVKAIGVPLPLLPYWWPY